MELRSGWLAGSGRTIGAPAVDTRADGWFATEVEILFEESQVFRPDLAGWRREHLAELPAEVPVTVRPDFVCEILSTNRRSDLIRKKRV